MSYPLSRLRQYERYNQITQCRIIRPGGYHEAPPIKRTLQISNIMPEEGQFQIGDGHLRESEYVGGSSTCSK